MSNYKFCPQCKNPLHPKDIHYYCPLCKTTIYVNPKPCVSVLPIKDGKVLLGKRAIEPYKGEYDLIGGFMEVGESVEEAAKREVKEETGLDIELVELLGTYSDQYGKAGDYTINIQFIAKIVGGKMKAQEDVASLHWLPIDKLPKTRGFKNTQKTLKYLQIWYGKKIKSPRKATQRGRQNSSARKY